jgi:hypothetical protein
MRADDPPGLAVTIPLRGRWWFEAKWVTLGKVGKRVKDEVGQVGGWLHFAGRSGLWIVRQTATAKESQDRP